MLKGVLWDLDGTLVEFKIDYKRARLQVIQIFESYGYPKGKFTMDNLISEMMRIGTDYFLLEKKIPAPQVEKIRKEIDRAVIVVETEAAQHATPMPGILPVLDFIKTHRLKIGVLTYNTIGNAILSLQKANLIRYFPERTYIVGRDIVTHAKPHPDHVNFLLKQMNLKADEICIIGDHPDHDIGAANNVNARAIAITTEKYPASAFKTPYACSGSQIATELPRILTEFLTTIE